MKTICQVCMHHCQLEPGQYGICRARKNENGVIRCENYGQITSLALDSIEKKPLHMFYPGSFILSAGSYGCNLRCPFCQNHEISMISQREADCVYLSPESLVRKAVSCQKYGNIGVAFTYNEPLIGWEYVRDTAKLLKKADMKTVLVTNGSASLEILDELLPLTDAMNIDLKGFNRQYYQMLGGDLETVKEFILHAAAECHIELTTLIIPGENDDLAQMEEEARWIASLKTKNASGQIPLHITRFFPQYHMMDKAPTDIAQIRRLAKTAAKYLKNVFIGNC
ncbi:MAG: AmmeMemoRadiSam system radical SAM enzyme [Lachnospiraceae bacterium]|nr:AmmeMemoRadiSam system radical SAM enzyme [Lachnospiraceae bacterium]